MEARINLLQKRGKKKKRKKKKSDKADQVLLTAPIKQIKTT